MERLKNAGVLLGQYADPGVAYRYPNFFSLALEREFNASLVGEFYGVIQKMTNQLLDSCRIAHHGGGERGILLYGQAKPFRLGLVALCRERRVNHVAHAKLGFVEFQTAGAQCRILERRVQKV